MPTSRGSRDAPILIDDEDEEPSAPVPGSYRLPSQKAASKFPPRSGSKALPTTSAIQNGRHDSASGNKGSGVPHLIAAKSFVPLPIIPTLDIAHSSLTTSSVFQSRKRKRGIADSQAQTSRVPPLPPIHIPVLPDPSLEQPKEGRRELRKRLRAEKRLEAGANVPKAILQGSIHPPNKVIGPAQPSRNKSGLHPVIQDVGNGSSQSGPTENDSVATDVTGRPEDMSPDLGNTKVAKKKKKKKNKQQGPEPNANMELVEVSTSTIKGTHTLHGADSHSPCTLQHLSEISSAMNSEPSRSQLLSSPLKPVGDVSHNLYDPTKCPIGQYAAPGSGNGTFSVSQDQYVPHDPSRTIVLENISKRFRTLNFVLQWWRDIAIEDDPAPLYVDVMRKLGKALVEFTTPEQAIRAFQSPKLINNDGRASIKAFWFSPDRIDRLPLAGPATLLSQHPRLISPDIAQREASNSSRKEHAPVVAPPRPLRHPSFVPYSQPIHIPSAITSLSLPNNLPSHPTVVGYEHRQQWAQMTQNARDMEMDDMEVEEGEIKEGRKPEESQQDVHIEEPGSALQISSHENVFAIVRSGSPRRSSQTIQEMDEAQSDNVGPHSKLRDGLNDLGVSSVRPSRESLPDIAHIEHGGDVSQGREDSPMLMYPLYEEPGFVPSAESSSRAQNVTLATPMVEYNEPMDVANSEGAVCSSCLSGPQDIVMSEKENELPRSDQLNLSTAIAAARGDSVGDRVSQCINEPKDVAEEKLLELRERVLASKKRRRVPTLLSENEDPGSPSSTCIRRSSGGTFAACVRPSVPYNSPVPSSNSTESTFSIESMSVSSSVSASSSTTLPKSPSSLDNMAVTLLEGIFGKSKSGVSGPCDIHTNQLSLKHTFMDSAILLEIKQKRLEEHLARSKDLLSQWEAAKSKTEKSRIWSQIREEKRIFEAEQAAADADLKTIKTAKATSLRPQMPTKRPTSIRWPQTRPEQLILSLSDSEEDGSASDGAE